MSHAVNSRKRHSRVWGTDTLRGGIAVEVARIRAGTAAQSRRPVAGIYLLRR